MKLCGTTMLAMFVAALAALIALWVLKTFGCPGAHRLGRCGLIAARLGLDRALGLSSSLIAV